MLWGIKPEELHLKGNQLFCKDMPHFLQFYLTFHFSPSCFTPLNCFMHHSERTWLSISPPRHQLSLSACILLCQLPENSAACIHSIKSLGFFQSQNFMINQKKKPQGDPLTFPVFFSVCTPNNIIKHCVYQSENYFGVSYFLLKCLYIQRLYRDGPRRN